MITAGIDVGSNTVRLLIADVSNGHINKQLCSMRSITRLGAGLVDTGQLSQESMDKTIAVFQEFRATLDEYNVDAVFAAATSAVREATNGAEFLTAAQAVGIPLRTISGSEEAEYTYLGIASNMANLPKSAIIYDIGGGSTEFTYVKNGVIIANASIPIGVVKLTDKYGFNKPTGEATNRLCMADIHAQLVSAYDILESDNSAELIGTAGSVTTIAAVELGLAKYQPELVNKHILDIDKMNSMLARLAPMTMAERLELAGLDIGREDLIIASLLMVLAIMDISGSSASHVSDYGLREGLAIAAGKLLG